MVIRFHKVVGKVPEDKAADTFYAVRNGGGYDLLLTDATGKTAHKLNKGPVGSTESDTTTDYIYFRLPDNKINRFNRTTFVKTSAEGNWGDRERLVYK